MRAFALLAVAAALLAGCAGTPETTTSPSPPGVSLEPCPSYCDLQVAKEEWSEYEPSVAVDPTDPKTMIVGVHDDPGTGCQGTPVLGLPAFFGPECFLLSAYVTHDAGATWNRTYLPHTTKAAPGSLWNAWCNMGDPVLLFDTKGTAYYIGLGISCADITFTTAVSSMFVATSTDGGDSWSEPVSIWTLPGGAQFTDKQWAAVDPVTGHLVVSWSAFTGCAPLGPCTALELYVSYSMDGAATWTNPPITVTRASVSSVPGVAEENDPGNWFAVPAWSANGTSHVAFRACGGDCVKVATSKDAGQTWTATEALKVKDPGRDGNQSVFFSYPAIAVDRSGGPFDGRIYVSTPSMVQEDYDIVIAWSDDGGATWTPQVRLNDNPEGDGTDQFHHWMDVEGGIVHAIAFDRRNDPDNVRIQAAWIRWDPADNSTHTTMLEAPWWPSAKGDDRAAYAHYITVDAVPGHVGFAWDRLGKENPSVDVSAALVDWPPTGLA